MSKKAFLILFLTIISSLLQAQKRSPDLLPTNVFKVGEYAQYKVIYKMSEAGISAGKVTFETTERSVDGVPHVVLTAKGNTAPAFDLFYKVRDEYATVMDPVNFVPKFFLRRVSEGGFKIFNNFDFDFKTMTVNAEMEDSKHPKSTATYSIDSNTQDIVSAILYCRNLNYDKLKEGEIYQFPVFIDREVFHLGIKYLGKKEISTDYGDFTCYILQPALLKGRVFESTDQMRIYVSADAHRLPILIESPLKVGRVVAVLEKYYVK